MQPTTATATQARHLRRVAAWLLLSFGLHLLLLLWSAETTLSSLPWPPLRVTLVAPHGDADKSGNQATQGQDPARVLKAEHKAKSDLARAPAKTTPPAMQSLAAATTPATQAATEQVADQAPHDTALSHMQEDARELIVQLQLALSRHFHYPAMAKRRGWQGEVLLRFRIESDGRIIDSHIAHGSGYSMLDRAALDSLQRVGAITTRVQFARQLELPVIYRLQEG